ncbi:hypothetical protein QOZ80_9BG0709820 [Eleusine coracana subsp. coracana]|nr:hypothetical protein QOZ80_9BG0709820 [Eleusine coracana subsp. coracana]
MAPPSSSRPVGTCPPLSLDWRAAIDARHGHLLPRSLHGIFINYDYDGEHSRLFSRPADPTGAGDIIDGTMDFVPRDRSGRLCEYYVCNPATRRWALLPEPLTLQYRGTVSSYPEIPSAMYLAFDPVVSLNYEVVRLRGLAGLEYHKGKMS